MTKQGRFSLPLYEAVFAAIADRVGADPNADTEIDSEAVAGLATSSDFLKYSQEQTTNTSNVKGRLRVARERLYED